MPLEYYNNYLKNIAKTPNESWREQHQQTITSQFDDTTLLEYNVKQETEQRDFTFEPIERCWVGTVGDGLTNSTKDFDDFREIYFEDCEHNVKRGTLFDYDDNYWLCYETPTRLEAYSHCKIRRCNNWLKWVDLDTGILYEHPCVVDYTLSSANAQTSKTINQANSHIDIMVQGNVDTLKIAKNRRFILNSVPYRFYAINNYMQNNYVDKNTPLLFMDFFLDMLNPEDNEEENIAEDCRKIFKVHCDVDRLNCISGTKGKINAYAVKDKTTKIDTIIEFYSDNEKVVKVDQDGNYEIIGKIGDTAVITARIKNNVYSSFVIPVEVIASTQHNYVTVIEPSFNDIKQGRSKTFNVCLYDNGELVTNEYTVSANWTDAKYYELVTNADNSFTLTNRLMNNNPLSLTFTNTTYDQTYELTIKLKATF